METLVSTHAVLPPEPTSTRDIPLAVPSRVLLADNAASKLSPPPVIFVFSCIFSVNQGTRAGAGQNALGSFFSVVVVDARDNKPRNTGTPNTALPAACRNKRQLGGVALAARASANAKIR